jgi:hypothetical protein
MANINMPKMTVPNLHTLVDFQKMVFIYNAINDGWIVKLLDDGRYEFRKNSDLIYSNDCLDTYLNNFIKFYRDLKTKDS